MHYQKMAVWLSSCSQINLVHPEVYMSAVGTEVILGKQNKYHKCQDI